MDVGTSEVLQVNALAGDDVITVNPGLAALLTVVIDAGAGNDIVNSTASSTLTLNGNTELDTLNFNGEGQAVQSLGSSVVVGGVTRVSHQQVEVVNVANSVGQAPVITITTPTTDPTFTSDASTITLAGTAADDGTVVSVTWVNNRGGSGTATGTTNWTAAGIPLFGGANLISVTATDNSGNATSDTLTVNVTTLSYFLSEGATGSFFDLDILIANPNAQAAPVTLTFLKENGTTVTADAEPGADVTDHGARRPDRRARGDRGVHGRDLHVGVAARRRALDVLGQQLLRVARRHRRRRAAHQVVLRRGIAGLLRDLPADRQLEPAAGDGRRCRS